MVTNNFEKNAVPCQLKKCRHLVTVGEEENRYYKRANNKRARRQRKEALRKGDYTYRPTPGGYIS